LALGPSLLLAYFRDSNGQSLSASVDAHSTNEKRQETQALLRAEGEKKTMRTNLLILHDIYRREMTYRVQ
jgi:hypothetical protein